MKTYELKTDETLKKYNYLWRMSRDRWAWEYLRRNKDFRKDAALHSTDDISEMTAPCRNANIRLLRSRVPQKLAARPDCMAAAKRCRMNLPINPGSVWLD